MFDVNVKILSDLRDFIRLVSGDKELIKIFAFRETAFSRCRKLPLSELTLLILKLCKKTLSLELENFFKDMGSSLRCSVSAFTQQRSKLKPEFFSLWNDVLQQAFYYHYGNAAKRWKGYRVVATDGSTVSLNKSPALEKHFGGQRNQNSNFILASTLYHYDVLNEIIVFSRIMPYRYGELKMAYQAIEKTAPDMLLIYDRNFSNYKMVALHLWQEQERKFIIRAKEKQKMISTFIKSGATSSIEYIKPTPEAKKGLKSCGFMIGQNTCLKVRLVRVDLPNSTEVLITNMWEEDGHSAGQFKDLYFMRWGIETNIAVQKNILQLECFSGVTVTSVMQDFYATVMLTNLCSVLIKDAQQTINESGQQRKYPMKVNKNKSFGRIKTNLVILFTLKKPRKILEILHACFLKDTIPIRKGRSFERKRKNPSGKSKHRTFTNFKLAS